MSDSPSRRARRLARRGSREGHEEDASESTGLLAESPVRSHTAERRSRPAALEMDDNGTGDAPPIGEGGQSPLMSPVRRRTQPPAESASREDARSKSGQRRARWERRRARPTRFDDPSHREQPETPTRVSGTSDRRAEDPPERRSLDDDAAGIGRTGDSLASGGLQSSPNRPPSESGLERSLDESTKAPLAPTSGPEGGVFDHSGSEHSDDKGIAEDPPAEDLAETLVGQYMIQSIPTAPPEDVRRVEEETYVYFNGAAAKNIHMHGFSHPPTLKRSLNLFGTCGSGWEPGVGESEVSCFASLCGGDQALGVAADGLFLDTLPLVSSDSLGRMRERLFHESFDHWMRSRLTGESDADVAKKERIDPLAPQQDVKTRPTKDSFLKDVCAPTGYWWLDGDGVMEVGYGNALKRRVARPNHWFDPQASYMMHVPGLRPRLQVKPKDKLFRLSVDVGTLHFDEHQLFNSEDRLCAKLVSLYHEYQQRRKVNLLAYYAGKLEAIERTVVALERRAGGVAETSASQQMSADFKQRIASLRADMRQIRQLKDAEEYTDLRLVKQMIALWEKVQDVRKKSGYTSTQYKLTLREMPRNKEADKADIRRQMVAEVADMRDEQIAQFEAAMEQYRSRKAALQNNLAMAEETVKTLRRHLKMEGLIKSETDDAPKGSDANDILADAEARVASIKGQLDNLKMPTEQLFDREAAMKEVKERFLRTKRRPGEPEIIPKLSRGVERDSLVKCDKAEKERRKDIQACEYYMKIFLNGRAVARTGWGGGTAIPLLRTETDPGNKTLLNLDFRAHFGEIFTFHVRAWPKDLFLKIYHKDSIVDAHVATIQLDIPGVEGSRLGSSARVGSTGNTSPTGPDAANDSKHFYAFSSLQPHRVPAAEASIAELDVDDQDSGDAGSDVDTGESKSAATAHPAASGEKDLHARGTVHVNVQWLSPEGPPPVPPAVAQAAAAKQRETQMEAAQPLPSASRLKEWIQKSQVDPNDPRNSHLVDIMKASELRQARGRVFRFLRDHPDVYVEDDQEGDVEANQRQMRQELLSMRSTAGPRRNAQVVVPVESNLDKTTFAKLANQLADAKDDDKSGDKQTDERKKRLTTFYDAASVRKKAASMEREGRSGDRKAKYVADVLQEQVLPDFTVNFGWLVDLFRERRKLNPARKKQSTQAQYPTESNVLLQVVRAFNLPVRANAMGSGMLPPAHKASTDQLDAYSGLRRDTAEATFASALEQARASEARAQGVTSFVEVKFQDHVQRTRTVGGDAPQWCEMLTLPFVPPGGKFRPEVLANLQEQISIDVFDEIILEADSELGEGRALRTEKRWMGSLTIPFSTLFHFRRLEGNFRLNVPLLNHGYLSADPNTGPKQDSDIPYSSASAKPPVLSLMVTLDPPLPLPKDQDTSAETVEDPMLIARGRAWVKSCVSAGGHCKNRNYLYLGMTVAGQEIFICKYIRSQTPPPLVETAKQACRFVATIPFLDDWDVFQDRWDVWCTSTEFLHLCSGDWEEHANLLCNYFLNFHLDAYVVVGRSVPDGDSCYVMVLASDGSVTFFNPATGEGFGSEDSHLSLTDVTQVYNASNIWGNIQKFDRPAKMSFRLDDPKAWRPFFSQQFSPSVLPPGSLASVQQASIKYSPTDGFWMRELENRIMRELTTTFEQWRGTHITHWNRACNRVLRGILEQIERRQQGLPLESEDFLEGLRKYAKTHDLQGFPINESYTDLEALKNAVKRTDIHNNLHPDVSFGLAVYVQSFTNNICTVWIYVMALTKK